MTNNTTNETKNKELTETKIEIQIRTGAAHSNKFQEAHTQIDYTSYYLSSIFWFIRVAIEAESLLELQTETKAYNDAQFREHIQFLVQMGEGLCERLPNYSGLLKERGETAAAEQPVAQTLAEHTLQIMANKISHILKSDKVSDDTKDAFQSIILEASTESNLSVNNPELVKTSLPLIFNALPSEGEGFRSALRSLLDSDMVSEIDGELTQYEKRFDSSEVKR